MGHHHHHHPDPKQFNLPFALAVGLNLAFTAIEAFYAIMANSMSLLADAGHNLGDVVGLLLAWGANWLLTKPASERYSYGYRRTTILASIINALLLVATSAIIAYESIIKLFQPEPVSELIVIFVAFIGIMINGGTALLFFKGSQHDLNIKGAFLHLAADALISIGVVITAVVIYYTDWEILDPMIGLGIVLVILLGTWGLLRDSVILLLDAVPHGIQRNEVKAFFKAIPGVTDVHDLHIWGLSTKEIALTVHLIMPDNQLNDKDFSDIQAHLQQTFNIGHTTIQVERGNPNHPCNLGESC